MTTPGISNKLQDKLIAPYRVLQKIDDLHYLLQPTKDRKRDPVRIHVDRIKRVGEVIEPDEVSLGPDPKPNLPQPKPAQPTHTPATTATIPRRRGRPPKAVPPPPEPDEHTGVSNPPIITTKSGRQVKPTKHYGVLHLLACPYRNYWAYRGR